MQQQLKSNGFTVSQIIKLTGIKEAETKELKTQKSNLAKK